LQTPNKITKTEQTQVLDAVKIIIMSSGMQHHKAC